MKLFKIIRKRFFHDVLGLHSPVKQITIQGIKPMSICRYCEKRIIQDSWGIWFTFDGVEVSRMRPIDADELKTAFPISENNKPVLIASVRATINYMPTIEPERKRGTEDKNDNEGNH